MKYRLLLVLALLASFHSFAQISDDSIRHALQNALQREPDNAALLYDQAMNFFNAQQYDSTVTSLNKALVNINKLPKNQKLSTGRALDSTEVLRIRAFAWELSGATDKAVADFRSLQQLKPGDFEFSIDVARLYIQNHTFDKAQAEIDRLKKEKNAERGLAYQAILYLEMQKTQEALEAVKATLQKYPGSIDAMITKAKILGTTNHNKEACSTLDTARALLNLSYFGGEQGYMTYADYQIADLISQYCK